MSNYLIVAIDTQLRDEFTKKGANVYYKDIQASPSRDCFPCRLTGPVKITYLPPTCPAISSA